MSLKLYIFHIIVAMPVISFGQSEMVDSFGIRPNLQPDSIIVSGSIGDIDNNDSSSHSSSLFEYRQGNDHLFNYMNVAPLDFNVPRFSFNPGSARIFSWRTVELIATGGTVTYSGLMNLDSGSIGIYQQTGSFSLYVGGIANKYGYFRGLHTQYGVNGSVTYSLSPKISLTAFSTYYFGKPPVLGGRLPMPPSMIGYYGASKFGGYVNYEAGERFGVIVGGQTVQQVGTQTYELEPIVTPYIKVGSGKKKVAIGLPVGQILHGVLKR